MKISNQTLDVLKNFAAINDSILIKPGNVLTSMADSRFVLARAEIEENFPREIPISRGLSEFLSVLGLFNDPDVEFGDTALTITSGKFKQRFSYSDGSQIMTPKRDPAEIDFDWTFGFSMSADEIKLLNKASSVNNAPNIVFESAGDGANIKVAVRDEKNPAINEFSMDTGATSPEPFKAIFVRDNLKMMPGDYDVQVHMSDKRISHWTRKSDGPAIRYWITVELGSAYGRN